MRAALIQEKLDESEDEHTCAHLSSCSTDFRRRRPLLRVLRPSTRSHSLPFHRPSYSLSSRAHKYDAVYTRNPLSLLAALSRGRTSRLAKCCIPDSLAKCFTHLPPKNATTVCVCLLVTRIQNVSRVHILYHFITFWSQLPHTFLVFSTFITLRECCTTYAQRALASRTVLGLDALFLRVLERSVRSFPIKWNCRRKRRRGRALFQTSAGQMTLFSPGCSLSIKVSSGLSSSS